MLAAKLIKNSDMFHMLGRNSLEHCLSELARIQAVQHNENVAQNRRIVGRLIDVVCYLGRQELAFTGHKENEQSFNKGNCLETLNLLAMEEAFMKEHIETSTVFKGTSSEIQNDLIESVSIAINETIHDEINQGNIISVQADKTTDISEKHS